MGARRQLVIIIGALHLATGSLAEVPLQERAEKGSRAGFADGTVEVDNFFRSIDSSDRSSRHAQGTPENVPAALPVDDGIDYYYERVCTSRTDEALDPARCVLLNDQCDAKPDGVFVEWIQVDRRTDPPSETRTGRNTCIYPGEVPEPPTAGEPAAEPIVITIAEFQSQPIAPSVVFSQPLNFGLKNAHSNVYAEAQEQEFTFDFRNAQIRLRAWPVSYRWDYGDGTSTTTTVPGEPAEGDAFNTETPTSHQYLDTGDYNVTLTTFFSGDYSVDGGPFQPIAGQAEVPSAPHLMSIWRTEAHSVADDCLENPSGIGCTTPLDR
ncbi:PKD domain-containing protein [Arthrobacter zhaoguopingii]|uniref:PKD domain-containing protein n=1 Tax=Arthrobacter zhaoguopingii TaxID=2681491 RepID=UPI001357787E|nr:PKD domain-containing protein [Arthrobacter zhaoguopingii]